MFQVDSKGGETEKQRTLSLTADRRTPSEHASSMNHFETRNLGTGTPLKGYFEVRWQQFELLPGWAVASHFFQALFPLWIRSSFDLYQILRQFAPGIVIELTTLRVRESPHELEGSSCLDAAETHSNPLDPSITGTAIHPESSVRRSGCTTGGPHTLNRTTFT